MVIKDRILSSVQPQHFEVHSDLSFTTTSSDELRPTNQKRPSAYRNPTVPTTKCSIRNEKIRHGRVKDIAYTTFHHHQSGKTESWLRPLFLQHTHTINQERRKVGYVRFTYSTQTRSMRKDGKLATSALPIAHTQIFLEGRGTFVTQQIDISRPAV